MGGYEDTSGSGFPKIFFGKNISYIYIKEMNFSILYIYIEILNMMVETLLCNCCASVM